MNSYIGPVVLLMAVTFLLLHKKLAGKYTLVSWFFISYGVMIGLGLAITNIFFKDNIEAGYLITQFSKNYSSDAWIYLPISFAFLLSVFLGACAFDKSKWVLITKFADSIAVKGSTENRVVGRYYFTAISLLFMSVAGYWLYVQAYGGFIPYIAYSGALRAGAMDELPPNPFSFLIAFGSFSFIASFLFYSLLLRKFRIITLVLFLAAFSFSIYVLFSWLGRIAFLFYFMVFFMVSVIRKDDLQPKILQLFVLIIGALSLLVIVGALLGRKTHSGIFQMLSLELIFPVSSLMNALEKNESFRMGIDFFTLPVYWLPQRFWADYLVSADAVNTKLLFGVVKGDAGNTNSVPTDILTLSYLNLGYLGFVFFGVFTGYVLTAVDFICRSIRIVSVRLVVYAYMALYLSVLMPIYADPSHIAGRLFPIVGFLLVMYFSKFCTIDMARLKKGCYVRD
ncbi:hypothetical protein [Rheinheimera sp.]|uniref:hypothetical protein n=1 Tax=Rheinheimera sp. TaxID=1869214 RepID=UPI003AF79B84